MTRYITIRQSIERAIAAIDRGDIKWTSGGYEVDGAFCIVGAAASIERANGGVAKAMHFDQLLDKYGGDLIFAEYKLGSALTKYNDRASTWAQAKRDIRAVLDDPAYTVDWSPAAEAAKKAGK